MEILLKPIGVIHSPFTDKTGIPVQSFHSDELGWVEVNKEYERGLRDLEGFSHIILLYYYETGETRLEVKPVLGTRTHGIFATRDLRRPNRLGFSVVRLLEKKGNILKIRGVDVLEGSPLLDIKPYVPAFDGRSGCRIGWLEGKV
ncbi:MAG: tRNA (N6-threonylcarbamoyladenosine(37)-N6)-methyltransferase TrmO [Deltaproteobacteria bacterium]|nr:tRNA (N6-threonylcarbamoyladenosine(37)-N6)-methyltransferase TrmO [Deltaproteobacteria bacterium]MBW2123562.1 tRNA (N6-threonylcarbamoyladenosine(37)-N6)-methyltransferase TrmO [Deltaproteobacteria bacterium]